MFSKKFLHNDPDSYQDAKISLHDCIADKISYENNVLTLHFSDGFWITANHEDSGLDNTVRTDFSQVDFAVTPEKHSYIYLDVFIKRKYRKTIVECWDLEKLMKVVNSGKYQLEFIYQYTTFFEQMWLCNLHHKGNYGHDCQFHIPYSVATYRWNKLRKDIVF